MMEETDENRNIIKAIIALRSKDEKNLPRVIFNSAGWDDRELMDLAIGLQSKGFADMKAVADCVKTKTEKDIRDFLNQKVHQIPKEGKPKPGRPATFNTKNPETIKSWPNIRKWRRLAYNQMDSHCRRADYSQPVMAALCKKFYEEEKETTNPEVINTKLIYKYMMDCMAGQVPAQLPPKESALVLELLRETRSTPIACDFEGEKKFLNGFKTAVKFRPFQVKDEFKRRIKKESTSEPSTSGEITSESNTVALPEEVFTKLSCHKKAFQCFNPLVAPVWMIETEQKKLKELNKESDVYVD